MQAMGRDRSKEEGREGELRDWDLEKSWVFFFRRKKWRGGRVGEVWGTQKKSREREREREVQWTVDRWINSVVGNMRWESIEV